MDEILENSKFFHLEDHLGSAMKYSDKAINQEQLITNFFKYIIIELSSSFVP